MTYSKNNSMRLQKYIAHAAGYCSRREAERLIENGRVSVNGTKVDKQGVMVTPLDEIKVDGHLIELESENVYYLLNKPKGIISTADDELGRKTVLDLVPSEIRVFPVGRLDKESTGALLLTNDGDLAYKMTHPKFELEKKYRVSVDGLLEGQVFYALQKDQIILGEQYQGMVLKNVRIQRHKRRSQATVILKEGKNRQIRKMFEHHGMDVLKLHRFSMGPIELADLEIGMYRELKPFEVKKIRLALEGEI